MAPTEGVGRAGTTTRTRHGGHVRLDYGRMAADGYAGVRLTEGGLALNLGQDGTAIDFRCSNCAPKFCFVRPRGTLASALVQR
jgi:hypothetical protein